MPLGIGVFFLSILAYIFIVRTHMLQLFNPLDLQVYIEGGQAVINGHDLYHVRFTWAGLPFTYTPLAALIFAQISTISFDTLKVAMTIVNISALFTTIWLAWGLLGYRKLPGRVAATLLLTGLTLWTEPVQQTLSLGQVNILIMTIIMADLCQSDKKLWKGIGVGFATGFKLTPAIFVLYLVTFQTP